MISLSKGGLVKMYDINLTRQSLPRDRYRLLLGTALCVFNSNNAFIIENLCRTDNTLSWYELIDKVSGKILSDIKSTISNIYSDEIASKYEQIKNIRDRIVHSFQITSACGEQILATKEKNSGEQFEITEEYLIKFIKLNEEFSSLVHEYRGF